MIISQATQFDVDDVLGILNEAARWLESRNVDQWRGGFPRARIEAIIDNRLVFLIRASEIPIATVTTSREGDPDFWWPAELAQSALYISKLAVSREHAGRGLGNLILRWLGDREACGFGGWLRLDAWRTNTDLHRFYEAAGWTHLRTVTLEARQSGALYEAAAQKDPTARHAFVAADNLPSLFADDAPPSAMADAALEVQAAWSRLRAGDQVMVRYGHPRWTQVARGRLLELQDWYPSEDPAPTGPALLTSRRTCRVLTDEGVLLEGLGPDQVRACDELPRVGEIHW